MVFKARVLKVTSKHYFCQLSVAGLPFERACLIPISPEEESPKDVNDTFDLNIPVGFKPVVEDRVVDQETAEVRSFLIVTAA